MKSYIECLDEISAEELYEGLLGYGMFSEKLPPVFSSKHFLDYCKKQNCQSFNKKESGYIFYESMRNINIPRPLAIPSPLKYANLCTLLKNHWKNIKKIFRQNTENDSYKVSRIHIRKRTNNALFEPSYNEYKIDDESNDYDEIPNVLGSNNSDNSIFSMNYKNLKYDGDPEFDFILGKKYVVKADISQCFPSIYTHAIAWALAGKQNAKCDRTDRLWYNKIDQACQKMRNGETHGIMIGPHSSNLLSEIILTSVDKVLREKGYDYIRNIDDYTCYVENREKAETFLVDLNHELREFDLSINHRKTLIEELPQVFSELWVQQLKDKLTIEKNNYVDYRWVRAYLDTSISLIHSNGNNASLVFFAIKSLANKKITKKGEEFIIKVMCSLAIIYPYLVPIMEKYVFVTFNASTTDIEHFANVLFKDSVRRLNFEGISYALYFAFKNNFCITEIACGVDKIIDSKDCISKVLLWIYSKHIKDNDTMQRLKVVANALIKTKYLFEENWLFVYEVLTLNEIKENKKTLNAVQQDNWLDEWLSIKQAGVSFIVDTSRKEAL